MENTENIYYFTSINSTVDIVYHNKVKNSYPLHTHAEHYTAGIVIDGKIIIETEVDKYICEPNRIFSIPVDMSHTIKPFKDCSYTMLSICVHQDYFRNDDIDNIMLMIEKKLHQVLCENEPIKKYSQLLSDELILLSRNNAKPNTSNSFSKEMKNKLISIPESSISIANMSHEICISSFHMIRQFKKEFGLTPHQFQIQCRIRKAQKMLLSDKTITEVALGTGFCDQSHFDKCFKKIVGMTPASYKKVARLSRELE